MSAPSGTTAPVEISIASPAPSVREAGRPAAARSTIGNVPGRSAALTAYPSIDELGNGGRSTSEATGDAEDAARSRLERHVFGRKRLGVREDGGERVGDGQQRAHDRTLHKARSADHRRAPRGTLAA